MDRITDTPQSDVSHYIDEHIEQIRYLYATLFPGETTQINLWWGHAPHHTPDVRPAPGTPEALPEAPGFLDRILVGDPNQPPSHCVDVAIPDPEGDDQQGETYPAWYARYKLARAAFRVTPILFERAKHWRERSAEQARTEKHFFGKLGTDHGAVPAAPTDTASDPATPAALIGFHWLEVGGAESLAFDTVAWALEAGLRVFVIAERDAPHRAVNKLPDDPRVRFLRTDRYVPWHLLPEFFSKLARQENITITHNHHCTALYESLPALRSHFPDMAHVDSTHVVEFADGGYPRISGVWTNFLDLHHVISRDLQGFLEDSFQISGRIQMGRLLSDQSRNAQLRAPSLHAGQTTCRVAFVGRMVHQKRPVLMVEIMRRLVRWGRKSGIRFEFDMVGEGPYREVCARMIQTYRLEDHVHLHEARQDVPALLAKSDILLLPSSNEGLALVCYEAIEAGCIPITTDVGAQSEIVPAELLVDRAPAKTVSQTVRLVMRLLRDQAFINQVSAEMARKFDDLRNEPSAKDILMPVYRDALNGG